MLVICGEAWSVYEFWNFTSKLVRSEVTDLLNCSSPCRLWLEVEREGRGKAVSLQLELGEAELDSLSQCYLGTFMWRKMQHLSL